MSICLQNYEKNLSYQRINKKMNDNICNNAKRRWLESLPTGDLLYLMMLLKGQIEIDESDERQQRLKRSFEQAQR